MARSTTKPSKNGTTSGTKVASKPTLKAGVKAKGKIAKAKKALPQGAKKAAGRLTSTRGKAVAAKSALVGKRREGPIKASAPQPSAVLVSKPSPELAKMRELVAHFDQDVAPMLDKLAKEAEAVLGKSGADMVNRLGQTVDARARQSLFFFEQAAALTGGERDSEVDALMGHGRARLIEAMAYQSSLSLELASQAMLGLMSPAGSPPDKIRVFQIGAPAYFPKMIHLLATVIRTRLGVNVADWEALISATMFSLANMDQFCAEPYISKRFGVAGVGRPSAGEAEAAGSPAAASSLPDFGK